MRILPVEIEGLKIIELDLWRDSRGFFIERFHLDRFHENGLPTHFVQDNHSRSYSQVLRGMHLQRNPDQGKLVGVVRGRIWDVVVDVRQESPTLGKYFGIELSDTNRKLLWVPGGFAHGFCVLGDESADVFYKVDCPYNSKTETGFLWSDPEVGIPWPLAAPIVSERDHNLRSFKDFKIQIFS